MKAVKTDTLEKALVHLRREYEIKIEGLASRVTEAKAKFDSGRVSTHDGFNLGSNASDLQECAAKIEMVENLIRFSEEL